MWKKGEVELKEKTSNSHLYTPRSTSSPIIAKDTNEEKLQKKLDQSNTNYQLALFKISYLESLVEELQSKKKINSPSLDRKDYHFTESDQSLVDSQEDKEESSETSDLLQKSGNLLEDNNVKDL